MPKKRPLETRLSETEEKLDQLNLEKSIRDLKAKVHARRRRR